MKMHDTEFELVCQVLRELERARAKFPDQSIWKTLAALTEEIGELNQAILEYHDEPHKGVTKEAIAKEIRQAMEMIFRVAFDCTDFNVTDVFFSEKGV